MPALGFSYKCGKSELTGLKIRDASCQKGRKMDMRELSESTDGMEPFQKLMGLSIKNEFQVY